MLLMDLSISSKRNLSAFQATFFEMLSAWSASFLAGMTRISREMKRRADHLLWRFAHSTRIATLWGMTVDVAPTLCTAAGIKPPLGLDGHPLSFVLVR